MQTHEDAGIGASEREAMRDSVRRVLAKKSTESHVRRAMQSVEGYDPALWSELAALGVAGLLIDPAQGGLGAGPLELEAVSEELGAALACVPFLGSSVLAAMLFAEASDGAVRDRWLPKLAAGERIAAAALTGDRGDWTHATVQVTATRRQGTWRLDGVANYVLAGAQADVLLVVARVGAGLQGFVLGPGATGLAIAPLQTLDRTVPMARIQLNAVTGDPLTNVDDDAIERTLDLARIALAGEQAGAARKVFDFTIEYIKQRVQFGRPVGGFQALKHMAADLLVHVESSTSAARRAAQALAAGEADRESLIPLAAFACSDAFSEVAAAAIQMHGGIAFTWEHPAHLYLRRARAGAQLFGNSDAHRERYLRCLERAR